MPVLFILDDDESLLYALQYWFEANGYEVKAFLSSAKFMEVFQNSKPDFVLIDVYLAKGEHGGELCYYLKKELRLSCPVFLFSSDLLSYSQFCEYKADGFLLKRSSFTYLGKIISTCIAEANKDEEAIIEPLNDASAESDQLYA